MVECRGAPYDQGRDQGEALAARIRSEVALVRQQVGRRWRRRLRAAGDGNALRAMRFLPQHHERLQGIAAGARVPVDALVLLDAALRLESVSGPAGQGLTAAFEGPGSPPGPPILRRTVPDVGGFASVELTLAPLAGSLAGVNSEGIAVVWGNDAGAGAPLSRLLVQELLLRAQSLEGAIDHARRRGRYLEGVWRLVVGDSSGRTVHLDHDARGLRIAEGPKGALPPRGFRVLIDPVERALTLLDDPNPETIRVSCTP